MEKELSSENAAAGTVSGGESAAEAVAERLRVAIDRGDGVAKVARRAGVPERSIYNFLKGVEMKNGALVALARACNVRLEWLSAGYGQMEIQLPASITMTPGGDMEGQPPVTLKMFQPLFHAVDMNRFSKAVSIIDSVLKNNARALPTEEKARAYLLTYDELLEIQPPSKDIGVASSE